MIFYIITYNTLYKMEEISSILKDISIDEKSMTYKKFCKEFKSRKMKFLGATVSMIWKNGVSCDDITCQKEFV